MLVPVFRFGLLLFNDWHREILYVVLWLFDFKDVWFELQVRGVGWTLLDQTLLLSFFWFVVGAGAPASVP